MKDRKGVYHSFLFRSAWIIFSFSLLSACNFTSSKRNNAHISINLNDTNAEDTTYSSMDTVPYLRVAVSAMISPKETFAYYKELFGYISRKTNKKIKIIQRKTYSEVNELLNNHQVDMAFICSGAYVNDRRDGFPIKIVAIPVIKERPTYQAYIITYKSSGIKKFEDLKGKSFAFTDPLSNTGYFYAISRIKSLGYNKKTFFKDFVFTYAHDISIQLVAKQIVDGASVDGLIFDYLKHSHPERLKNIRIVEKSQFFGIPPIVVPPFTPDSTLKKLQRILCQMDKDSLGIKILKKLMIDRFIPANDSLYNSIRRMDKIIRQ